MRSKAPELQGDSYRYLGPVGNRPLVYENQVVQVSMKMPNTIEEFIETYRTDKVLHHFLESHLHCIAHSSNIAHKVLKEIKMISSRRGSRN